MTIYVLFWNQRGKASGIYYIVTQVIDLTKIYSKLDWCRFFLPLTICTLNASLSIPVGHICVALWRSIALIDIHLDIKSDNILQEIEDKSILESFTQAELKNPSPRKVINGLPVYASRCFDLPKVFGRAVLSDFGSAVQGNERRNHDAQPNVYRSPEVMLKTDWSYPIDIWNVGAMVCISSWFTFNNLYWSVESHRCGICLRGSTFSMEMTLMAKGTRPGHILLKSWEF